MAAAKYKIIIKSPNDKIPSQAVECLPEWKVRDLKSYLSEHHPARPNLSSQRLIHAGKLLGDNLTISSICDNADDFQTIHLVCPNPKPLASTDVSCEKTDDFWSDISPEQLHAYQQAYYQYLQTFYMESSANQTDHYMQNCYWPYAFGTGVAPHMLPGSPDLPNALTSGSQVSSLPTQGTLNDSSNNLQPLMQRAQAFLSSWAVSNANQRQQEANEAGPNENAVNDQRADRVEPQVAQQVIVFDNAMRNNARQDEEAEGVENMDIIDRFYMLFRLCLFVGLCFAYSSLDKAVIVFSVAAYVYIYNVYRRYAVAERLMQARRSQQNQQIDQGSSNNPVNESDSQQNQSVSEPSSSEVQTRANMPNEQEPRLTRITAHLRTAAGISYQFFSALISSIIPEQPPPLHLD